MKHRPYIMIFVMMTGCAGHNQFNPSTYNQYVQAAYQSSGNDRCSNIRKASVAQDQEFTQLLINKQSIDQWTMKRYELDTYSRDNGCGTIMTGGYANEYHTTYPNYNKPYRLYRPSIIPSDYNRK